MAVSAKIAELYVELSAKGNINKSLDDLRARIVDTDSLIGQVSKHAPELFSLKMLDAQKSAELALKFAKEAAAWTGGDEGQKYAKENAALVTQLDLANKIREVNQKIGQLDHLGSDAGQKTLVQRIHVEGNDKIAEARRGLMELKAATTFQSSQAGQDQGRKLFNLHGIAKIQEARKSLLDLKATGDFQASLPGRSQGQELLGLQGLAKIGEAKKGLLELRALSDFKASRTGQDQEQKLFGLQGIGKVADSRNKLAELKAANAFQGSALGQSLGRESINLQGQEHIARGQAQVQHLKMLVDYQASPDGQRFLKEQVNMGREVQKFKAAAEWQKLVAEQGKFGAGMTAMKQKIDSFGAALPMTFAAATASITGFVAAASPMAMSTFTTSFQILSAEIGTIFVPAMMQVSLWVQQAADWFRDLDAGTKSNIATWALWGVGLLGAAMVLPRLITMIQMGGAALAFLNTAAVSSVTYLSGLIASLNATSLSFTGLGAAAKAATAAVWAFMLSNPMTALLAIVGAVAAVVVAMKSGQKSTEDWITELERFEGISSRLANGRPVTNRDLREVFTGAHGQRDRERLQNANPEEQQRLLEIHREHEEERVRDLEQSTPDRERETERRMRGAQNWRGAARYSEEEIQRGVTAEGHELSQARARLAAIQSMQTHGVPGAPGQRQRPLLDWQQGQFGHFSGIDQQWRRLQTAAAGLSPAQQRLLETRIANTNAILANTVSVEANRDALNRWLQANPDTGNTGFGGDW